MSSTKKTARAAGLLYLLMAIPAAFSLTYLPGKLIVQGNATATAANILASEPLFRLAIASQLTSAILSIFFALALYRLLKGVSRQRATHLVILVLIQVPITFLNEVSSLAALMLVRGADFLSVFAKPQQDALAMMFIDLHDQGLIASQVFWGLWLFPFGLLVYRSGFLPRFLGVWLILNGFAYAAICFTGLLLPQYYSTVFNASLPVLLGGMVAALWLLIMGVKEQPPSALMLK